MVETFLLLDTITSEKTEISTTWYIYPTPGRIKQTFETNDSTGDNAHSDGIAICRSSNA